MVKKRGPVRRVKENTVKMPLAGKSENHILRDPSHGFSLSLARPPTGDIARCIWLTFYPGVPLTVDLSTRICSKSSQTISYETNRMYIGIDR